MKVRFVLAFMPSVFCELVDKLNSVYYVTQLATDRKSLTGLSTDYCDKVVWLSLLILRFKENDLTGFSVNQSLGVKLVVKEGIYIYIWVVQNNKNTAWCDKQVHLSVRCKETWEHSSANILDLIPWWTGIIVWFFWLACEAKMSHVQGQWSSVRCHPW